MITTHKLFPRPLFATNILFWSVLAAQSPAAVSAQQSSQLPAKRTAEKTLEINGAAVEGKLLRVGNSYYVSIDDLMRATGGSLSYSDTKVSLILPPTRGGKENGTSQAVGHEPAAQNSVVGRVFAVTNGGELKAARFAKIGLLQGDAVEQFKKGGFPDRRAEIALSQQLGGSSSLILEGQNLRGIADMLELYERFNRVQDRNPQLVTTIESDEEGQFQFKDVKPGKYSIVAFGRPGPNAACGQMKLKWHRAKYRKR
jgi:hypothetical protein